MHIFLVFSFFLCTFAPLNGENCCCSSVVEHFLGKEEVTSSSLVNSSKRKSPGSSFFAFGPQAIPLLRNHPCSNKNAAQPRPFHAAASSAWNILRPPDTQSSPIRFISIHHHASVFGDGPHRVKTALEHITSRFALHYIFLQAILISNRNQNKVQNFSFSTKFPVLAEYCRCIFLHLEHFTAFPNCYINASF